MVKFKKIHFRQFQRKQIRQLTGRVPLNVFKTHKFSLVTFHIQKPKKRDVLTPTGDNSCQDSNRRLRKLIQHESIQFNGA